MFSWQIFNGDSVILAILFSEHVPFSVNIRKSLCFSVLYFVILIIDYNVCYDSFCFKITYWVFTNKQTNNIYFLTCVF